MKRRNFFSKIAKGLLGIGIVTALPTPEVETVPSTPQNLSATERFNRTYAITGTDSPKGMAEIGHELYIIESDPTKAAIVGSIDSLPDGFEHKHTVISSGSGKKYTFRVMGAKANKS